MHVERRRTSWLLVGLLLVTWVSGGVGHAAGESALVEAAKQGNFGAVRAQLVKRANVNEPGRDGSTALLWAAYHSDVPAVRALLAAGAKPNVANKYGVTPLLQASRTGDTAVMQVLVDAGADVSMGHTDGETPVMAAARTGRSDAVRLLLARGASVNVKDGYQQQAPLMWAASEGHTLAPHDFFGQPSARRRMRYVQGNTARGWGLGGSPEGDWRGLSLVGARRHGAVVRAPESLGGHRAPQGGLAREPQSSPWRDGGEALAVA